MLAPGGRADTPSPFRSRGRKAAKDYAGGGCCLELSPISPTPFPVLAF